MTPSSKSSVPQLLLREPLPHALPDVKRQERRARFLDPVIGSELTVAVGFEDGIGTKTIETVV